MQNPAVKYRADIDGLRAVAVLSVLVFHAFPAALPGGFLGVDIFFVISGFLIFSIIYQNLQRGNFSIADFYQRRIRRIFPALLTILIATFIAGYYLFLPDEMQLLGKHVLGATTFLSNFVLWNESGYFDKGNYLKPLMHLWSLAVEEQFYLVVPLLLWALWRRIPVWVVMLVLVLASFAYSVYCTQTDMSAAFFSPLSRFWEIGAGCLAGFALSNARSKEVIDGWKARQPVLLQVLNGASFLALVYSFTLLSETDRLPGWLALPVILGTTMLLLGLSPKSPTHRLLALKPMVAVGLISYPLYLWHWPIISILYILYGGMPPPLVLCYALAGSFVGATATYFLVEKPVRFTKPASWWVPGTLLVLMLALAAVGYHYFAPEKISMLVMGNTL